MDDTTKTKSGGIEPEPETAGAPRAVKAASVYAKAEGKTWPLPKINT